LNVGRKLHGIGGVFDGSKIGKFWRKGKEGFADFRAAAS